MIVGFRGKKPIIHETAFVHTAATVIGEVEVGENSNIWPGAVLRGDFNRIKIGHCVSVQDNAVIHSPPEHPVEIGDYVVIGHSAVVHGCAVENNCLIGGGSVLFDGARVRKGSLVGIGAVVLGGMEVPPKTVVVGIPARPLRGLTDEEVENTNKQAVLYAELAREYKT